MLLVVLLLVAPYHQTKRQSNHHIFSTRLFLPGFGCYVLYMSLEYLVQRWLCWLHLKPALAQTACAARVSASLVLVVLVYLQKLLDNLLMKMKFNFTLEKTFLL